MDLWASFFMLARPKHYRIGGRRGRKGGLMNARAASSPYILSRLLKCGVCGNNFTLVSGTGKRRRSGRYGTVARFPTRGVGSC
jgi:hypothetical protein